MREILSFLAFRDKVDNLLSSVSMSKLTNEYLTKNHANLVSELEKWFKRLCPTLPFRNGCSSCFSDHFWHLKILSIKQILEKMNIQHKLREEVLIELDGEIYTHKSPHLTNEICEKIYKKFGAEKFEKYDPDWRKKIVTEKQVIKVMTAEDLDEFFAEKHKPVIEPIVVLDNEEKIAEVMPEAEQVPEGIKPVKKAAPKKKTTKRKR